MENNLVNGGQAIARCLEINRIDTVFGLLGGSMLELYDAIRASSSIRYIGARDERAAGHMADAWARMRNRPGVVLGAQAGPGVANLVTAVAEAHLAYSPLVAIAGAISRNDQGKDTFQELDQVGLFQGISKRSIQVNDAGQLIPMLEDAFRLAMAGRKGPVVLHVPRDLFNSEIPVQADRPLAFAGASYPGKPDIDRMVELLGSSAAPLIVAGGGFKWGSQSGALRELAENLGVPVVAAAGHADVLPSEHELFAGQAGPRGNAVATGLLKKADLLLVLGSRLAFNSTMLARDAVNPEASIVQVDVEASAIGRYYSTELGVVADAGLTAQELCDAIREQEFSRDKWNTWREQFRTSRVQLVAERRAEYEDQSSPMLPTRALGEIRAVLPDNAIVTLDTGNTCLQAADRLRHESCPSLVAPLDFGLVGFGYAAAIGASSAAPGRPVLSIMGDGGFGYTMAEINTAVQYQLPVIAVVLDNGAWGAEKAYQQTFFDGRLIGAEIASPNYADVAELCGADGYRVTEPGELEAALKRALDRGRPAVIHAKIDPSALKALRKDLFKPQPEPAPPDD